MSDEEKKLAKDCAQLHFSSTSAAALASLRQKTGLNWKANQLFYLNKKEKAACKGLSKDASSADRLVKSFDSRKDVSYVMITYRPDEGLMSKRRAGRPTKIPPPPEFDPAKLYEENKLKGGKRMLLIFCFASDEELRSMMMHPEFISCDTTFGTTKKKQELFTIASLDGNNKGFNGARAFIPSACQWVFYYCFRVVVPVLWGPVICRRVRLCLTDGATQEIIAFLTAMVSSPFLSNG